MTTRRPYSNCVHCGCELKADSFNVRLETGYEGTTFGPIVDGYVMVHWQRTGDGRAVSFVCAESVYELLTDVPVPLGDALEKGGRA